MHILHIITTCDIGGAEVQLLALAKQQIKSDHQISILPLKGSSSLKREFEDCGAIFLDFLENKNPLMQLFSIKKLLKKKRFDIVHAHLPRAQLISALASTTADKLIVTRHDAMPFYSSGSKKLSMALWKIVKNRSKRTIVISSAIARKMLEREEIQNVSDVVVIHYGLESSSNQNNVLPTKLLSIKKSQDIKFVCVARFVEEKNHESLIRAFAKLKSQKSFVQLFLIGYGTLEQRLRTIVQELSLDDSVQFMGRRRDIQQLLSVCDVSVLPSHTEGFGLVLLEAMQAGLPILASRVDAIPEILGEKCGLMFDPRNVEDIFQKMMIATDKEFRLSQSRASLLRLGDFSIKKASEQIEEVYSQVSLVTSSNTQKC